MQFIDFLTNAPRGTATRIARMADVAPPMVHIWARRKGVPPRRAPLIEMVTGGLVTCEEMCPDEPWRRIPDREWRWHKGGRPVIDVASLIA